jgi:hypothetical protein
LTISPVGILWHGGKAVKNLGQYAYAKCVNDASPQKDAWEKTYRHANAFFTDLSCFTIRLSCSAFTAAVGIVNLSALTLTALTVDCLWIPFLLLNIRSLQ